LTTGFGDYYPTLVGYDSEAVYFEPTLVGSHKGNWAYVFRTLGGRGPLGGQKGLLVYGKENYQASLASAYGPLTLFILDRELTQPVLEEIQPEVGLSSAKTKAEMAQGSGPSKKAASAPTKSEPKALLAKFIPHDDNPRPNHFPNPFSRPADSIWEVGLGGDKGIDGTGGADRIGGTGGPDRADGADRTSGAGAKEPKRRDKRFERKKYHPPKVALPGGDLFLDPVKGYLMTLSEALGGGKEKWPEELWPAFDGSEKVSEGVTFVWAREDNLSGVAVDLAKGLTGEGPVLVLSGLDGPLEALAMGFREGAVSVCPRPSRAKELDSISLENRLDKIKRERKEEAERIRADFSIHQKSEKLVTERLECWTRLQGLSRSLNHLRNEAHQRKAEWNSREIDLIDSQREYDKAEKESGGLMVLLGLKNQKDRLELSKAKLEASERAMRRVRLEVESLLNEAKTVDAELSAAKDRVKSLPDKESLEAELEALKAIGQSLISQAAALELPINDAQLAAGVFSSCQVIVSRLGAELPISSVDNLIVAAPVVVDHKSREALTALAMMAKKRLVIVADFTPWSWTGAAPTDGEGNYAWRNFLAPKTLEGPLTGPAAFLGPLPKLAPLGQEVQSGPGEGDGDGPKDGQGGGPSGGHETLKGDFKGHRKAPFKIAPKVEVLAEYLTPNPAKFGFLSKMGFSSGLAKLPLNHPTGPSLRAFDDIGPFCPVSALSSVRLAVEAVRKAKSLGEEANVYVMTASKAQGALARSLLEDFGRPKGIMAGEPQDFELWPQAPLVILDTALAPPQASNGLSSPEMGRPGILRALNLAAGALVVCGSPTSMEELTAKSPLRKLWSTLTDTAWPGWLPLQPSPFWEALDQAKNEAFMVLPAFEPDWWGPLANHFLSALRRKVKMTIISELPKEEARQYPSQVIRELRLYGANVLLSEGFSDLMTLVDGHHFSMGAPGGQAGYKRWPFLVSLELPNSVPLLMDLFQYKTIQAKLGPGGLHGCPLCGWPYLLVNQGKQRDFDFSQALRLGCLNPSCPNHKRPRRLDERWPISAPPACPVDKTPYVLKTSGRTQSWVCPKHGPDCPSYRFVPGDCPTYRQ
jgi:hypothetical protein